MKVLKDFTTNNRPKHARSALWPKREEIFELARQNFSTYQIVQYLQTQKIETSQKNVNNFLRKHFKNKTQGDKNPTNYQPAPARAPQSPAKAGVNLKEQIGAEANAEAENKEEIIWDAVVNEDYRRNSEEIHKKYSKKD